MKRSTRTLAAGLVAAVAFGVTAPAAIAVPGHGHHHVTAKADKGKPDKVSKATERAQRQATRIIAQKDRALTRSIKETRTSHLAPVGGVDTKQAVIANVATDLAALTDLRISTRAADALVDVRQVRRDLRQVRAVNYVLVVNVLRQAAHVQRDADALGGVAEVTAAVDAAVAKAVSITATSPRADIRTARADLSVARDALAAAEESAETDPVDVPVV